MVSPDVF